MVSMLKTTCCLMSIIGIALAATLPEETIFGLVPCTKSDPKLGECLKTSIQSVVPNLVKGIPSIGLLPIDPFRITSLEIQQGTGPVSIKLNLRDLDVSNIGTVKINQVNTDQDLNNVALDVDFEKPITLDGNYDIKGKVMVLPITGDGKCKISLDNVKARANVYLKHVVRNENTYVEIQELSVKFTTTRMHINLDNLFNGDKVLGSNMNTFLNENWKDILGELESSIEKALVTIVSDVAKQVLIRVPLNQVLKD